MKVWVLIAFSTLLVLFGPDTSCALPVSDRLIVTETSPSGSVIVIDQTTSEEEARNSVSGPFRADRVSAGQGTTGTTAIFLLEPCCATQISDILFVGSPPPDRPEDPGAGSGTVFFFVSDPFDIAAAIAFINSHAGPGKDLFGPVNCTPPFTAPDPANPKPACPLVREEAGGNDLTSVTFSGGTVMLISDVPLPGTFLLILSGLAAAAGLRKCGEAASHMRTAQKRAGTL